MRQSVISSDLKSEVTNRARIFSAVAVIFLLLFGIESLYRGLEMHALQLFSFAGLTLMSHLLLSRGKYYRIHFYIIVFLMGTLCLTLLYTGGIEGSGPLWYYVFPLLALFVLGIRDGLIAIILLALASLIMITLLDTGLDTGIYNPIVKERFIAVFIAVTALALIYEYTRHRYTNRLQDMYNEMMEVARTDDLTGLPNRRYMNESLSYEAHRSHRNNTKFSVILCDIDHFKQINDNYGHDCGDFVLKTVAELIRKTLRNQDIVARWGGEEFLILLPDTMAEGAALIAERLRRMINTHRFDYLDKHFFISHLSCSDRLQQGKFFLPVQLPYFRFALLGQ